MPYFCDQQIVSCQTIPIDKSGQIINSHNYADNFKIEDIEECNNDVPSGVQWECSPEACGWGNNSYTLDVTAKLEGVYKKLMKSEVATIRELVQEMDTCSINTQSNKNGHHETCYENVSRDSFSNKSGCNTFFLTLRRLQKHFPRIRSIVRELYRMKKSHTEALFLHDLFNQKAESWYNHYRLLVGKGIIQHLASPHDASIGPSTNSDTIVNQFSRSINAFNKQNNDLPTYSCLSCKTYKRRFQCLNIKNIKMTITNSEKYLELLRDSNIDIRHVALTDHLVCHTCNGKLKKNMMPPLCYMNRMGVTDVRPEIKDLREWESMLTRRGHAFQSIYVSKTVSGSRRPSHLSYKKHKGVTLYLPIPIEETLATVLQDDEVFRTNYMRIAVRTGLGNRNVIFESIVDIPKVYNALKIFKYDYKNPLYANLPLPETLEEFRVQIAKESIHVIETDSLVEIEMAEADVEVADNSTSSTSANLAYLSPSRNSAHLSPPLVLPCNPVLPSSPCNLDHRSPPCNPADASLSGSNYVTLSHDNSTHASDSEKPARSMLTHVTLDDLEQYANCTIIPLGNHRIPTPASDLYKFERVEGTPMRPYLVKDMDVRCYPHLFPCGKYGMNDPEREIEVREADYMKARICSSLSPRFRQDKSYLFHLHNYKLMKQLSAGIYSTMNMHDYNESMTGKSVYDKIQRGELDKPLSTIFNKVRGTEEFFKIPKFNVETMIRNYGPATWFLTLSPTEWLWPELKNFLLEVNPNLKEQDKKKSMTVSELTAIDPVNTSTYFENRFQSVVKFLYGPEEPLGKIKHYFFRREYQGRGVTHFHCMIWIEGAPVIGVDSDEVVTKFIQKYLTCQLPKKNDPLFGVVDSAQRHYCNNYCQQIYKGKQKSVKYCRFKFPRELNLSFKLNDVAKSIAARGTPKKLRLYDLPRGEDEKCINDYNPAVLYVARCNMDLQFISESSCTVTEYVCKYQVKPEKANLEVNFNKSAKSTASALWSCAISGCQSREVGSIEAADTLQGRWLTKTDPHTFIKFVDTRFAKRRKLKPSNELHANLDSNDIFILDNVDDRYPNRPDEMEETSLINFFDSYDVATPTEISTRSDLIKLQNNKGFLKARKHKALVSHFIHNKIDKKEEYYQSLLLLFKPWRTRRQR